MTGTGEEGIADAAGLGRALEERLGSLPWWVISVIVHTVLVFLFVTSFIAVEMLSKANDVFVTSEFEEPKEEEVYYRYLPIHAN